MAMAAMAQGAGQMGSILDLALIPFKIGQANAQRAEALYQQKMQKAAAVKAAASALDDEQRNIAALEQNAILSDLQIESDQRKAEATAKVQAAAAGVEGGAVEQVIQTTEINEAMAKGAVDQQTEQALAQSLKNIESAGYSLEMAVMPEFKSNAQKQMMNAVFGMAPGVYGLMTGQGPSGMFGLFGTSDKHRVDKEGSGSNILLS